jgi:peptidoglycan/xylan/chitin deacetylase (PgdA/CDA1 family)
MADSPGTRPRGPGRLVISLDFELHWGVHDKRSVEQYRANLLGVREAVPRILELFREHGIHATWATVGFLFFENKRELISALPESRPTYANRLLDPYRLLQDIGDDEARDPYHYAPSLIRRILDTPYQEIATHTFSHFSCLENGQTEVQFRSDIEAAKAAAVRFDIKLRSIVFPRNQVNYLGTCAEAGLIAYRGTEMNVFSQPQDNQSATRPWTRAQRLLDTYIPLGGCTAYRLGHTGQPTNVPSSRFLRPWSSRLTVLEGLRLRRITADLERAARDGMAYHLWWHPHNFGINTDQNLAFLALVLRNYVELRERYGMLSQTMAEAAQ